MDHDESGSFTGTFKGNNSSNILPQNQEINPDNRDLRFWNKQYENWKKNIGPRPGPHPDPDCIWNQNPEIFDFHDYKE